MSARCLTSAALCAAGLLTLPGCTTFGGNVKGSFSCQAPDGICAPSSTIDDRAMAMISGEAGDVMIPAGPYQAAPQPPQRSTRTALASPRAATGETPAARTREKVLRIVFQPYVDDRGRLHEASAVHTVVQSEWQAEALADARPIPDRNAAAAAPAELSLVEAVDREAPGTVDIAAFDPNLPDPAVVAAARARGSDPVAAIKADVAKRLTAKPERRTTRSSLSVSADARASSATSETGAAASASQPAVADAKTLKDPARPAAVPPAVKNRQPASPASLAKQPALESEGGASSGPEAMARVKASEAYRDAEAHVQGVARQAGEDPALPSMKPLTSPTIRAASFPAAVPEDK